MLAFMSMMENSCPIELAFVLRIIFYLELTEYTHHAPEKSVHASYYTCSAKVPYAATILTPQLKFPAALIAMTDPRDFSSRTHTSNHNKTQHKKLFAHFHLQLLSSHPNTIMLVNIQDNPRQQ